MKINKLQYLNTVLTVRKAIEAIDTKLSCPDDGWRVEVVVEVVVVVETFQPCVSTKLVAFDEKSMYSDIQYVSAATYCTYGVQIVQRKNT